MPKKSIYIPDEIADIIAAGESESYSGRIAYIISIAHMGMLDAAPELELNEWLAVASAMNGYYLNYEAGSDTVLRWAWLNLLDAAPELNETWCVSCGDLARRIQAMPRMAQAGILEVVRAFWARGPEAFKNGADNYQVLNMVGAKITPPFGSGNRAMRFKNPLFAGNSPINNHGALSVSVEIEGHPGRCNLGEVARDAAGVVRFTPNAAQTGGSDAHAYVDALIAANREAIEAALADREANRTVSLGSRSLVHPAEAASA